MTKILLLAIAITSTYANESIKFKNDVHLSDNTIKTDKTNIHKIKCNAYSDKKSEGIKTILVHSPTKLSYSLYCKRSEVGVYWSIITKSDEKKLSEIEYGFFNNADGEKKWRTDAWLVDLNNDGFLDYLSLYKKYEVNYDVTGNSKDVKVEEIISKQEYKISFWNKESKKFESKRNLPKSIKSVVLANYNFK